MELIAPAGDWDCVKAAVEHGADAVYFGLQSGFNARARAVNFAPEQLSELTAYLRRRGAKGYVTLNTLVFPGELEEMERTIRTVAAGGVDAAIVQDLGVARLMREVCPTLPIHASTQMTLSSAACIAAVAALGIQRVVLPRELSIDQIALLRRETNVALEVFVHGAMCLSYSGQCLASAAIGGRSANRGQCAQPCRLPYELICDGRHVDLGDCRYLLSPHDLAAYDLLPQLLAAGVDALKIEGRLKSAEYVANVTQHYRQALDREVSRFSPGGLSQFSPGGLSQFSPERKRDCPLPVALDELELSFSRGFSHGWLEGRDHKALVSGRGSAKRGVLLGRVRAVRGRRVAVELVRAVARGDGLMFETGRGEQAEQGGRVYEIFREGEPLADAAAGGTVELAFGHDAIDMEEIRPGQQVWMTDDAALTRRLRKSFSGGKPKRRVALDLLVEAAVGQPLRITAQAASGAACRLQSPQPLETAVKHPLTSTLLGEQLGRLGSTVYELRHLEARIDGQPMIPLSVLGKLRHEMLRLLDEAADRPPIRPLAAEAVLERLVGDSLGRQVHDTLGRQLDCRPPELHVLCRSLRQLQAVLACGAKSTIVDLADLAQYEEAVRNAHAAGAAILLATPRIQKPGEEDVFSSLASLGADGILARNLAGLAFFSQQGVNVVADFSLNAANQLTVAWLREQGASRVTASYDLDRGQLLDLVAAVPPECLEVVVHQHMPMFHTEHCVFCTTLSAGESEANCGRLCKKHAVRLRDRLGVEHPLRADATCRNTLFHAVPQSAAEIVPLLVERGVRHFRIELLDDADPPGPLLEVYGGLLAGQLTGSQAWGRLQELHPAGLTRGTLR